MAVEKQNRTSRTPLPNGATSNSEAPVVPENTMRPEDVVQVPSTSPPPANDQLAEIKIKESQSQVQVQNEHPQNGQFQTNGRHEEPENANEVDVSDLRPFDWDDFRRRYKADINKINEDEESLYDDFDKLAQAFGFWGENAANRDNERACKRLCTRERYVLLAEEALEEKKRRYHQVVEAFKQALEMLRSSGL
ncbi:hypothetical protein EG329_004739 [Mollisiaceae sp. DMI_Dod_QoI]|nr:hypothetical protein EG329_004739 [Helotiales sp. DMI_Dod_QoI]